MPFEMKWPFPLNPLAFFMVKIRNKKNGTIKWVVFMQLFLDGCMLHVLIHLYLSNVYVDLFEMVNLLNMIYGIVQKGDKIEGIYF